MPKKVVIIDELGFSRICSALLELQGYSAECRQVPVSVADLREPDVGLVVTSFPYGEQVLALLCAADLPVLVLVDSLNDPLLDALKAVRHACCMVKPLDYEKFTSYIRMVLVGGTIDRMGRL